MRLSAFVCCFVLPIVGVCTPSVASAQASDVGLTAVPSGGSRVGTYCAAVRCSALPLSLKRGSKIALTTWGSVGTPYFLAIGAPTKTCTPIPGFANQLMLGTPILVFQSGITGRGNSTSVCLIGQHTITVSVPSNSATGTIHMQALAQSRRTSSPAFTPTLAITVK